MGFDGVELVMECEDEFGISISDDEAGRVETPGDLTRLVLKLMRRNGEIKSEPFCLSARLFYRFRSGLCDSGIKREQIKLDTPIGELLDEPKKVREASCIISFFGRPKQQRNVRDHLMAWCVAPVLFVTPFVVMGILNQHLGLYIAIGSGVLLSPGWFVALNIWKSKGSVLLEPD